MPRAERPLDEGDGQLLGFAADLRRLRAEAGSPAYRELSRRAHFSATALSDAAGGRRLPSLPVTLAYVAACGGNTEAWERRWRALAAELAGSGDGEEPDGDGAPYVGLAMFRLEDAERFFGRERLVAELADQITRQRLVVVVGPSGSGKSSLLRAGLVHQARTNRMYGGGPIVVMTPGSHPLEECAAHLAALAGGTPTAIHDALRTDPRCLHRTALQALASTPPGSEVLVIVDQFEEVFTLCRDPDERAQFLAALHTAARVPNSRTRIVLGLRADFYAHCAHHPELLEALRDAQVLVGPMTTEELRAAITQPALNAGCRVETALVSRVIADATGQPGVLPLVSHALLETWRRRRGTTLTLAGYDAAGGMTQSIAHTAETIYTALSQAQQQWARQLFLRLVAFGEGTEDTKRRLDRTELDLTNPDNTTVLERLAHARLITLDRDGIEITHEALIRSWPRLHTWLTDDRDGLRIHRQLTEAASTWEALERDPGTLYRGTRLAQADQWAAGSGDDVLSLGEREFLQASLAAQAHDHTVTRRRSRRLRQLLALLSILLVLTTTATAFAVRAQRSTAEQRTVAIAQKVLSQAAALRASNPTLAQQLTLAAYRLASIPEARTALLNSFATPYATRITDLTGTLTSLAFSPNRRILATTSDDWTLRMWDITTPYHPRELASHPAPSDIAHAAFSPDGRTLAFAKTDQTVELWDVTDPRQPHELTGLTNNTGARDDPAGVAFSPDGTTLAVAGVTNDNHGTVTLWDVSERRYPRELATLTGRFGLVYRVVFLPGSHILATANTPTTDPASGSELRLWDVTDPAHPSEQATVTGFSGFIQIAVSPDGRGMATSQWDTTVTTWDVTDVRRPQKLITLAGLTGDVNDLSFSPDGHTLATASSDRAVRLWDVSDMRQPQALTTLTGFTASVMFVAFSLDGRTLATGTADNIVRLEDVSDYAFPARAHGQVHSVSFHPDGRTLATAHSDGTVVLWDTAGPYTVWWDTTGPLERALFTASTSNAPIIWAAFSPDGKSIATTGMDGTLALWNLVQVTHPSARPVPVILNTGAPQYPPAHVAFSPDGRMLATGYLDGTVELWDIGNTPHRTLSTIPGTRGATAVVFHPNGRILATKSSTTTTLWDLSDPANPRSAATVAAPDSKILSVAFSPDGRTMATGNSDNTLRLWDVTDTSAPRVTTKLNSNMTVVAFSPDGRTLAAGMADDTTQLWDVTDVRHPRSPVTLAGPTGGGNGIGSIAFSPNNHILATAGMWRVAPDRSARLWDTDTERVAARICERAWPAITPAEWSQYFPGIPYRSPCP